MNQVAAFDPYETLGVARDANRAAIRSAYRKAAKRVHPDAGGSAAKFAKITRALAVLEDPDRRAHFDQTGEAEEKPVDNRAANIALMLSAVFGAVLADADQGGRAYETVDIPEAMVNMLARRRRETVDNDNKIGKHIANLKKLMPRFHARAKGERNQMAEIVNGQIISLERQRAGHKEQIEMIDEAITVAKAHRFETEQRSYFAASPLFSIIAR